MLLRLGLPLIATIAIELGVLLFLGERQRKVLWGSVVVNILTNMPLNLLAVNIDNGLATVIIGELAVVVVEALFYKWLIRDWTRAALYSLFCNAISFLTGELFILIFYYFIPY